MACWELKFSSSFSLDSHSTRRWVGNWIQSLSADSNLRYYPSSSEKMMGPRREVKGSFAPAGPTFRILRSKWRDPRQCWFCRMAILTCPFSEFVLEFDVLRRQRRESIILFPRYRTISIEDWEQPLQGPKSSPLGKRNRDGACLLTTREFSPRSLLQWALCISEISGSCEFDFLSSDLHSRMRGAGIIKTHKPPDGNKYLGLLPPFWEYRGLLNEWQGYCRYRGYRFGYRWKWRDPGQSKCLPCV